MILSHLKLRLNIISATKRNKRKEEITPSSSTEIALIIEKRKEEITPSNSTEIALIIEKRIERIDIIEIDLMRAVVQVLLKITENTTLRARMIVFEKNLYA
jgi:hypothetical protein